jgi:hypothetical protein
LRQATVEDTTAKDNTFIRLEGMEESGIFADASSSREQQEVMLVLESCVGQVPIEIGKQLRGA